MNKVVLSVIILMVTNAIIFMQASEKPIIVTDFDDVLIRRPSLLSKVKLVCGGVYKDPWNAVSYVRALNDLQKRYTKNSDGINEVLHGEDGKPIHGISYHFLYHASRDPRLAHHVEGIVTMMEQSNDYIHGTKEIYEYLKEQGYQIILATNKDRVAYDIVAEKLGSDFTSLFDKVFVAHGANTEKTMSEIKHYASMATTPESYKSFANKVLNSKDTDAIYHVVTPKPALNYYSYLCNQIRAEDKTVVFVDDSKANNDAREGSDIDIAIDNKKKIDGQLMANIMSELEESDLPIHYDIVDYHSVSEAMQKNIIKDGVRGDA